MGKTKENLQEAFSGESQAYQRYLAFAQRAADEYKEGVYKLFIAVAESEKIHAKRQLGHLKAVNETAQNLKEAISGETHEFMTLYPRMMKEAEEEGEQGAVITFDHSRQVESYHRALFVEALKNPEGFPVQDYFICKACGYLTTEKSPERC
ncbi:MAG: rubrerythrin family protein, partial [Desulfatiglandales bacterium]